MAAQVIHVGIVAHTTRAIAAKRLAKTVLADFVSIDNGILGCDANHQVVQRHLAGLPGDWSVLLEDDAVPVDGFRDQLAAILDVAPTPLVGLYLGRQRPPQYQRHIANAIAWADEDDAHWIIGRRMLHAVGYAIRTELLGSLADFSSRLPADEHVSAWVARDQGYNGNVSYCWPSLVDHADEMTIARHRDGQPRPPGRTAWRTGTRDAWTTRSVALGA